ncbi:unnamed protein product [Dimorphilus gyrociliatus]|uniref:Uncharacterized protein n=1 Tax=Dimorphilus gyrociliatus TaxID=2664684 RepID=A0A7I8V9B9_9ANNE|nr:unnamed protein product [Dimorphilus gyrociliatus]
MTSRTTKNPDVRLNLTVQDWMQAIRKPTPYRVGSSVTLNTNMIRLGIVIAIAFVIFFVVLPVYTNDSCGIDKYSKDLKYNNTYPLSKTITLADGSFRFRIAVVTDLDTESKSINEKSTWYSYYRKGYLIWNPSKNTAKIEWDQETKKLISNVAAKGRSMELSELIVFNGKLYTVDDRTGIVYQISEENQVIPWVILSNGDGKQVQGFKSEWATVKDERLYIGGLGKEWTTQTGQFVNTYPQWIKSIGPNGDIKHLDWSENYNKLREVAGFESPGYMIHESAYWSDIHKKWIFLPRRASKEKYDETLDENRGTNLLFLADEEFKNIHYQRVGPLNPSRGFSSFKFIPGTNNRVIVALKSEERNEKPVASYITIFTITGNVLLAEEPLEGAFKFEGIEFI